MMPPSQQTHNQQWMRLLGNFIFLSRWLQAPLNAGVLKVKLATALIGISSIHLLKTFIELGTKEIPGNVVMWQVAVHMTFVASALFLALTDKISTNTAAKKH